jgi:hypothetical protein
LRQKHPNLEASLGYTARPCLKKDKKKKKYRLKHKGTRGLTTEFKKVLVVAVASGRAHA